MTDGPASFFRHLPFPMQGNRKMFKPNYSFEKRQKELLKQRKKEEKRLRKTGDTADLAAPEPATEPPPAKPVEPSE
jgi:hypothetical protein